MTIYRRWDLINCRDPLERSPRDGVIEGRSRACVIFWAGLEHGYYMFFRILYMRGCSPLFDQESYGSIDQWRYALKRDLGHYFLFPSSCFLDVEMSAFLMLPSLPSGFPTRD